MRSNEQLLSPVISDAATDLQLEALERNMEAALFKSQEVIEVPHDEILDEVEVEDPDLDASSEELTPADDSLESVQGSGA